MISIYSLNRIQRSLNKKYNLQLRKWNRKQVRNHQIAIHKERIISKIFLTLSKEKKKKIFFLKIKKILQFKWRQQSFNHQRKDVGVIAKLIKNTMENNNNNKNKILLKKIKRTRHNNNN